MVSVIKSFFPRLRHCHESTREDKKRLRQFKTYLWDNILLGNVWTQVADLKEELKQSRIARNEFNYVKSGQHFGHFLSQLIGGIIPD